MNGIDSDAVPSAPIDWRPRRSTVRELCAKRKPELGSARMPMARALIASLEALHVGVAAGGGPCVLRPHDGDTQGTAGDFLRSHFLRRYACGLCGPL
ncbi:MAG: hypothetical protein ABSC94_01975 [Polyangiaceae bacterium]